MNILGAIIGDICGSVYEWNNETNINNVKLFKGGCHPTDDSVLTCAVMDWLMATDCGKSEKQREVLIEKLREYAQKFPRAGYGTMFRNWIWSKSDEPIGSFGNGSAMRVSACGFAALTIEEGMELAKKSAEVTHDHPEGVKGAQAVALAIMLVRLGYSKNAIKKELKARFDYDLDTPLKERPKHKFDATCQITVPEALMAFFEGNSFKNTIKRAIAIGGDSDTIAAIAGSIAGAYYGIPTEFVEIAAAFLPTTLYKTVCDFNAFYMKALR